MLSKLIQPPLDCLDSLSERSDADKRPGYGSCVSVTVAVLVLLTAKTGDVKIGRAQVTAATTDETTLAFLTISSLCQVVATYLGTMGAASVARNEQG